MSINELPPMSESIQSHLDCCYFLINQYINLISDAKVGLSPYLYGWKRGATEILPVKNMKTLPNHSMLLANVKNNVVEDVNVLKTMFRVLSFAYVNVFLSRNLSPCKIQAFSHSFLVRRFFINGQFP